MKKKVGITIDEITKLDTYVYECTICSARDFDKDKCFWCEKMKKDNTLNQIKNAAKLLFGETEEGCCVSCKKKILSFRDELSQKEFTISGFCQDCQDSVFGNEESAK